MRSRHDVVAFIVTRPRRAIYFLRLVAAAGVLGPARIFRIQKFQQFPIEDFWHLDMGYVAHVGEEHQLRIGNRLGNVFGQRGKVLAIPLSA